MQPILDASINESKKSDRFPIVPTGLIVLALTALFAGCEKSPEQSTRTLRVGFAQIANEGPWRDTNSQSIKEEADKRNIHLDFRECQNPNLKGQQQQEDQKKYLRDFIKEKVDVIAFSPVVEGGWREVLEEATAARIPVILSDRGVSSEDQRLVATFIGSDFREEGRRAARWLVNHFKQAAPVNIVEVQGTPDSAPAIQRHEGFNEILSTPENRERFRIEWPIIGNFNYDEAKAVVEDLLKRTNVKQISVLFAHSDAMALAGIAALEDAGLNPGKDVKVVSIDATDKGCEEIKKGRLNCAVECKSRLGPQVFDAAEAAAKSQALPARTIISEGVYDRENVDQCGHE